MPPKQRFTHTFSVLLLTFFAFLPAALFAQGEDNPTGVTGVYNGNIDTGGSYDPLTKNAVREVTDIVVPGSVGAYPLKWTRYFNSRDVRGEWTFSYRDYSTGSKMKFPDGREIDMNNECASGFADRQATVNDENGIPHSAILLADGGQVLFDADTTMTSAQLATGEVISTQTTNYYPVQIVDPYGQRTKITYQVYMYNEEGPRQYENRLHRIDKIIEPGSRYLKVTWKDPANPKSRRTLSKVEAFDQYHADGSAGTLIEKVIYTNDSWSNGYNNPDGTPVQYDRLRSVSYDDGTSAQYEYSYQGTGTAFGPHPVLLTASDVRYGGPMRQIEYQYDNAGKITKEKKPGGGETVSSITMGGQATTDATETRGDGATRSFTYGARGQNNVCRDVTGKLLTYTDFLGNTTTLDYTDGGGFVHSVKTVNNGVSRFTTYDRGVIGAVNKVTYADGSFVEQQFTDPSNPYYLKNRTAQRGPGEIAHTTVYERDAVRHWITKKTYPDGGFEEFVYDVATNDFGQVIDHHMTSGGWEHFEYNDRGLKTASVDAYGNRTTFLYFEPGHAWADRVMKITHPANASGLQATEIFEYDRHTVSGLPCPGRGLLTKTTYADNNFVSHTYNQFGEMLTTTDELNHTTTFTYDDYGRLLTTTTSPRFSGDTQNHTTTNSYLPDGQTSSYVTTSKLPWLVTLPSGKQVKTVYDANWRKTTVTQAPGTADQAISRFGYDDVGNLTKATDPKGSTLGDAAHTTINTYDIRDRQISSTDALGYANTAHFDLRGNKDWSTRANTQLASYHYDVMERVDRITTQRNATTSDVREYHYNLAGVLDWQKDENTNLYSYGYDLMNRRTTMIYPNGKHEDNEHDGAGNVKSYTSRAGAKQTFVYDLRNRPTSISWSNITAPTMATPSQTTVYDAASRKTDINNDDASIKFVYNNDNTLASQEEWSTGVMGDNVHRTVAYTYDADGNRQTIQYPGGTKLQYGYSQRNQLKTIADEPTQHTFVTYGLDVSGNITARSLDNGTSTAYTPDNVNRETALAHTLVGTTRRFDYAYNNVNDITAVKRDSDKGDGYSYDLTQTILGFKQNGTVDLANGTVSSPTSNTDLTFDGCGNRTSLNGTTLATPNNMNQPTDAGLSYDDNGNLRTSGDWTYTYDALNRLRIAENSVTTEHSEFYYDGLNRQIARAVTANPVATPAPTPTPSPTATPTPTPTPTATPTPTPTPSNQVAPVTFSAVGTSPMMVSMSCATSGATIFYKIGNTAPANPTHTGLTPTNGTLKYTSPVGVNAGQHKYIKAIAYKSGMTDSVITDFDADNSELGGGNFAAFGGGEMLLAGESSLVTTVTYSVWDSDWALLEEYAPGNLLTEAYVQGLHGLIKTLVSNVYYYQDSMGNTSHVATAAGQLLEWYKYDLYGKPTYWAANNTQLTTSNYAVRDLFGGGRWMPELGLYDNRNRFMSPDLGRFLQPDPIGFKGDASNLYRYCGNDWANRIDPLGLEFLDPYVGTAQQYKEESKLRYRTVDLYGYVEIRVRPGVEVRGNDVVLLRYNVTVGQRHIATESKFTGKRTASEIEATKKHEDKHPAVARTVHDEYQKKIGTSVGGVQPGEKADAAAKRVSTQIGAESDKRINSHEPKSEWNQIRDKENPGGLPRRAGSNIAMANASQNESAEHVESAHTVDNDRRGGNVSGDPGGFTSIRADYQ
jgi:RHS repeat-associated protein